MKQIVMTLAAMLLLSTSAMAQGNFPQNGQRPDPKEMIQRRTDRTVQQYGLNAEQAKQLLSLNTKYADVMMPRGGLGGQRGQGARPDGNRQRPAQGDSIRQPRGQRPEGGQRPQGGQRPEMNEQMKAYEEELQKIMTPEQYKAYQADRERMRQNMGRGGMGGQRGQRGRRPQQN